MNTPLKSLGLTETILFAVTGVLMLSLVLATSLSTAHTSTHNIRNVSPASPLTAPAQIAMLPAVTVIGKRLTAEQKIALATQDQVVPAIIITGKRITHLPSVLIVAKRLNLEQKIQLADKAVVAKSML